MPGQAKSAAVLLGAWLIAISGLVHAQAPKPPVDTFLLLRDTPDSYSGQAGKAVIVNPAANGLIFGTAGGGSGTVTSISALSPLFTTPDPITATGILSFTAPGLSGNVLTSNGTTWVSLPLPAAGGSVSDTAYGAGWNGSTTVAPSQNALYDWAHTFDTNDNGTPNKLDLIGISGPGVSIVGVNNTGIVSIATPGTDYESLLTFADSLNRTGSSINLDGDNPTPGASKYYGTDGTSTKGWFALPASGGVTSFSSGDLSPLFTTTEPNTAGAVAQSFALTNVTGPAWFGKETAGSGAPAYSINAFPAALIPAFTGDVTKPAGSLTLSYANAVPTAKGGAPVGGTAGFVLKKNTGTDYDYSWAADATGGGGVNSFGTITVAGQSDVVAETAPDTLTLTAGSNITLTTNASTDTVTIAAAGGGGGTVTDFSAGDLSPLFTTTEATTTTTPALSFALTAAPADSVFANDTTSSAAPKFTGGPRFARIANLTTDGFVKTSGGNGTLSVDTSTYLTSTSISDTAYASSWDGVTTIAPSKNAIRDWGFIFDPDYDGKVEVLDLGAGLVKTSAGGVVSTAVAGTDYLTGNQTITLSGAVTGTGTTAITTTYTAVPTSVGGVPIAGANNYVLKKLSALNYDYGWLPDDTGQPADADLTALAAIVGVQGDVIYYGASGWTKLAAGSNGNQLTTHGAGANPTWDVSGGGGGGGGAPVVYVQTTATNPTGTTSLTGVMAGLGSTATFTPAGTGKVFVTVTGVMTNGTDGSGVSVQLRYGALPSGTPPPNGVAPTGTAIGSAPYRGSGGATAWLANQVTPFSVSAVISGLTAGTPIWIDLEQTVMGSGTATIANVSVAAFEVPAGTVTDGVYPTGWDTDTGTAPSRNSVRDYIHLIDTDDDGKVNVLDTVAGLVKTDASGVVSNAVAGTDYQAAGAYLTANQPISLTGEVTGGPAATSIATTIADGITVANWTLTTPQIAAISNLTTNGFVKTGGAIGTLSVDTATYQPSDADLTTWAGITPTTVGQSFVTLANPGAITFPEISATNVVSAKTASQLKTDLSLTATDVGLGNVTNNAQTQAAIVPNTAPSAGQILIGNAGNTAYAKNTVSGSGATVSLGATGVFTISAIPESSLSITDLTTGNATTSAHGFAPKGTVGTTQFWRQDWTLATPGGGGAPTGVDYLVGTADGTLSAEIVVGTSPGGELGGTWASPTLDDGITVANWTLTTPQIAAISNLTTNGFVKTGGAIGTLSVDTNTYLTSTSISDTAYAGTWDTVTTIAPSKNAVYDKIETLQPLDADLTAIAGITGVRGDVLFYGASGWARLGVGTSGQQLTTGGAGADPTWAAAGSGGGGTPSGPSTAVQFEDAGAFGGDAGLTYNKTTDSLTAAGQITATSSTPWNVPALVAGSGLVTGMSGAGALGIWLANASSEIIISGSAHEVRYRSDGIVGWASTTDNYNGAPDTAFARNAAGVVEVNNGTASQFRDLKLRTLLASDGSYPSTPSITFASWTNSGLLPWPGLGWPIMTAGGTPSMAWLSTEVRFVGPATWGGSGVTASSDVGIGRSAAGTLKVSDGGAGTGIITGNGTVPTGGSANQVLAKNSATNYDVGWATPAGGSTDPRVTSMASSATPAVDVDAYDAVSITALAADITSMSSGLTGSAANFQKLTYRIKDNGTARNITWGASFSSSQSTLPTKTVTGKVTTVGVIYDSVKTTWECVAVDVEDAALATVQTSVANTAATSSTSYVMGGLNAVITPAVTGKMVITVSGSIYNTSTGGSSAQLRYGTGTAPSNGAADTGTVVGGTAVRNTGWTANMVTPFSLTGIATGLTVGTAYWIDCAYSATANTSILYQVAVTAYEIP